jgi:hypothetical protein
MRRQRVKIRSLGREGNGFVGMGQVYMTRFSKCDLGVISLFKDQMTTTKNHTQTGIAYQIRWKLPGKNMR